MNPDRMDVADRREWVLAPDIGFAGGVQRLQAAGWTLVQAAERPLVPGEPEHALLEHPAHGRLHLGFNPVAGLRTAEAPARAAAALADAWPIVTAATVAGWLGSDDERVVLRGLLAAAILKDPGLRDAVAAHGQHSRPALARAAERGLQALDEAASAVDASAQPGAQVEADLRARSGAMAAIELIRGQLAPIVLALGQDRDGTLHAALKPRAGDAAKAFLPPHDDRARLAYDALWAAPPPPTPAAPGSRLVLHLAPAGMLHGDNELSRPFPSGYRRIAGMLNPHRVWACWKLIPPGRDAGMAYDGLVWLDDHWAWFPKPYRWLQ